MDFLSLGGGVHSTVLPLMACENLETPGKYPLVPNYAAIIFCDLGLEAPWVYEQVRFVMEACSKRGMPVIILRTNLYQNFIERFGKSRVVSIPFWSVGREGRHAKMKRQCTLDYKVLQIQKFIRWNLLGYRKGRHDRPWDLGEHQMHIGFSAEEQSRIFDSYNPFYKNKFPLWQMGLERKDNYAYLLERWGLDAKGSACAFCPYHRNYFFKHIKMHVEKLWKQLVEFDRILEAEQPNTPIDSQLYISRSRKRLTELTDGECRDMECFYYRGRKVWNGF